jgi:mono/diheme cytochrome c family protein/glucose/arabinose dehydrogenase
MKFDDIWKYAIPLMLLFVLVHCSRNRKVLSPVLSPQESLKHFKVEKGFKVKLVASEPLVQAPIAIKFDAQDRPWVVEMPAFMRDTAGTGQGSLSLGKIVILEDKNHDGVMDHRKVFMDSLILPRAISFYKNGLLVAEPPKLLYVKNNHDSTGAISVIDSNYAVGGNAEDKPNGLVRGLDNWIYSAQSAKRYRKINGKWVSQHTHYRGHWGITQDKYGRLFYNHSTVNLQGDYFLPGLRAWNPAQEYVSGFNEIIASDNRVYPIHPTPGVNRGYRPGVLNDKKRLAHFTAACSPVIYMGGAFGHKYEGNAFVAEPAGNLVARDILQDDGYKVDGKQANHGKDFLASDDERFRPVDLKVGPDGALYVVDMYRGIIQGITYLTPYLKNQIKKRHLRLPLNRGRIYKIVQKGKTLSYPGLSQKSPTQLVDMLDAPNGWVRRTAQRLLVDETKVGVEKQLHRKLKHDSSLVGRIHAFWTLEGLGKLRKKNIEIFLQSGQPKLQWQAIAAIVERLDGNNAAQWIKKADSLFTQKDRQLAPHIGFLGAAAEQYAPKKANGLLLKLALRYKNDRYVSDAVISGLSGQEKEFMQQFQKAESDPDTSSVFYRHLKEVIKNVKQRKMRSDEERKIEQFANGKQFFETFCQRCHGADGNGIHSLGAPLNGSPWVTGDKQTLISIVLFGLTGPIKIGGKVYKPPEVAAEMPSFRQNAALSNNYVAQILSYIRNAWTNEASPVNAKDVERARQVYQGRKKPFTMDELNQLK